MDRFDRLAVFPGLTMAAFLSAIVIGLAGTWGQAFGYLPAIGFDSPSLAPWTQLLKDPGLTRSLIVTLISGLGSTLLALFITLWLLVFSYGNRFWVLFNRALAPLLAVPHAAFAIGFLFLASPSGWILRLISPGLTGFEVPPDWHLMRDGWGISLLLVLVIKEVPFLMLISLAALSRLDIDRTLAVGRSLGYHPVAVRAKILLPQLYPRIRLAVFAVLAYALSVVDVALLAGPTTPPTLAVQVFRWFNDPDLSNRLTGAAGATLILVLVGGGIGWLRLAEAVLKRAGRVWLTGGRRRFPVSVPTAGAGLMVLGIVGSTLLAVVALGIWSFAWRWRFPDALPSDWSLRFWQQGLAQMSVSAWNTVITGLAAALLGVVLVIGCLENEASRQRRGRGPGLSAVLWLIYLPLLVPQIAFLFGVQVVLALFRLDGTLAALIWSHLLFVLPYVFLSLGPVYRSFDARITAVALTLCQSPGRAFWRVKLPMLLRPVLFAAAIGFSVSVAQYLPTLFVGAGRFATLTTEAVTLAVGADRRVVAVYALCQALTPLLVFLAALLVPRFVFRNRRAMRI